MTMNEGNSNPVEAFLTGPILVPLDGSEVADGILPYVSQLAEKGNLSLVLLTAIDPDDLDYPSWVLVQPISSPGEDREISRDEYEERARNQALAALREREASLQGAGIATKTIVSLGKPAEVISRVADEEGCGLIAMSTHGRNAIARGILGSVTDRVIHSASTPVLALTPEKAQEYRSREGASLRTIVVPLDGSELAERALPYAEKLARLMSMRILLTRAVRFELPYHHDFGSQLPHVTEEVVKDANQYLGRVANRLERRGLRVTTKVMQGTPAQALLQLAHDTPQSLIAITTNARSGLSRWMMGSVAEALVRGAGEPVLVIRPRT